ncbi:MAG: peptidase A24A domain-containing protein, leader peptidase (prepilin peptidase) / N-methyltransferase [Berkelbacteria bacterium GW2011_GWE1_39_12]|uniref:Peptidase A24A domain-containing protein, leader peptidase (Prepilin peptidase) / N-methyltransferase n=1 Tax=Berkelbacteria bacterium GW2011_GWE1_39_12 TaxID=1618337 RepID=A0A0G4B229_9BACT|nr:MAG: peptidase A24A domain-containing protein, leader peptidase (prepilin peptidase) / N-methyltransferase [Berkelbacteria bacterium GW2011_GWE1_39_12]
MLVNVYFDYIIVAIFGLIIGSFLNVIILRFDDLRSVIKTRSHCPECKKQLHWYDLFPFFSFVLLAGKCRFCKKPISVQYPLVELATALIFALLFWKFGFSLEFAVLLIISSILMVVLTYDILHFLIADFLIWLSIGLWVIYLVVDYFFIQQSLPIILSSLYGGLALGGFLGLIVLVSWEKWMGIGDIKLGFLLGAISFWPNVLLATFAAFALGSVISLALIFSRKKTMKDMVPFAPFLIIGGYVAIFWGDQIIKWYLNSLGMGS